MIEESTQPARVVAADLKRITLLMTSTAFSLYSCNGGHHSVSYPWIFCHFHIPPFTCFNSMGLRAANNLDEAFQAHPSKRQKAL
jgi:hypothetical protein